MDIYQKKTLLDAFFHLQIQTEPSVQFRIAWLKIRISLIGPLLDDERGHNCRINEIR